MKKQVSSCMNSKNYEIHVDGRNTDEMGFIYASSFSGDWEKAKKSNSGVRRRALHFPALQNKVPSLADKSYISKYLEELKYELENSWEEVPRETEEEKEEISPQIQQKEPEEEKLYAHILDSDEQFPEYVHEHQSLYHELFEIPNLFTVNGHFADTEVYGNFNFSPHYRQTTVFEREQTVLNIPRIVKEEVVIEKMEEKSEEELSGKMEEDEEEMKEEDEKEMKEEEREENQEENVPQDKLQGDETMKEEVQVEISPIEEETEIELFSLPKVPSHEIYKDTKEAPQTKKEARELAAN